MTSGQSPTTRLGIVACGGALPGLLIAACQASRRDYFVIAIEGQADPAAVIDTPHQWVRLGAAGKALQRLHAEGVDELVLAGSLKRPSIHEVRPDARFMKFLAKGAFSLGDDGLLRAAVRELESQEGFRIIGPDALLADHLAVAGRYGTRGPDATAEQDIARGIAVQRALGTVDVGQSVIVQQGIVLGVEAVEGTDALIERCATLRREGPGGILIKLTKPGQERRVDLPAIGPETVTAAARAGLRGIAMEAAGTLILDRARVASLADAAGIFVIGIEPPRDTAAATLPEPAA